MTASAAFARSSIEETVQKFHTSADRGLDSQEEAKYRRNLHGSNILEAEDDENPFLKFVSQFYEDPLIVMLIVSAGVSLLLGNTEDALSIAAAIFFVVSVGFVQEYRSEQSLKALNNLVPPSAHVTRGGETHNALASTLVVGDLVRFSVGDRVPADVRITSAVHLTIDESSLTGETTPVEKNSDTISQSHTYHGVIPIGERSNIAYMGTLVTDGHGAGIVVGIGADTEFGNIFRMMSDIDKPKTPLQTAMSYLGKQLSVFSLIVIGCICLIGIIQGRSFLEMFQIGVSLAVAAIPEGLPIIVTVTLALGVLRMAKKNAIVRRLPSVETLGSVDVVCSDKTGTLTMNKLSLASLYTPGSNSWTTIENRHGKLTPTIGLARLLNAANMANNAAKVTDAAARITAPTNTKTKWAGNPVDVAFISSLEYFGLVDDRTSHDRITEVPFNSTRKWMAAEYAAKDGEKTVYLKGALEKVLPMCSHFTSEDGKQAPITEAHIESIQSHSDEMAAKGMRIISLAYGPESPDLENPQGLTFAGLGALTDPPRPGTRESIRKLREGGVKVIMITGDNELTAVAAARDVGIPIPMVGDISPYVMTGATLGSIEPRNLSDAIDNILVFARTSPEMKVTIVKALQYKGHVVGMTGDGVNDAPALKLADIGISMGSGTDVAKEASDMILVDDDFSTILEAIKEGKAIFSNVKSFLSFQLSTSVAALSLVSLSTLGSLPNPLNAMQILWINILMDGPPAQSLGVEPVDPDVMLKPPRSRSEQALTPKVMKKVAIRGTIILLGTMFVYVREMADNEVTRRDTTMSFTCFVFFDLFNALASRSATRSVFELGLFSNKMFNIAVGCSMLGQLAVIYIPFLQNIFQTEAISLGDLFFLVVLSSSILWVDEFLKYQARQKRPFDAAAKFV